jgi:hypothetical protein
VQFQPVLTSFAGGCFNPILPTGNRALALQLMEVFRPDVLVPVSTNEGVAAFAKSFAHLPWPFFQAELVKEHLGGADSELLDIVHPLLQLKRRLVDSPFVERLLPTWSAEDPLADVFLASYGGFVVGAVGDAYSRAFHEIIEAQAFPLGPATPIPPILLEAVTPREVARFGIERIGWTIWHRAGLYVGSAADLQDLMTFWNLRAAGVDLVFYDPAHNGRLSALLTKRVESIVSKFPDRDEWDRQIAVWRADGNDDMPAFPGEYPISNCHVGPTMWNGLNLVPQVTRLGREVVFAIDAPSHEKPSVTMTLPAKPWLHSTRNAPSQHVVMSFRPYVSIRTDDTATYHPFDLPLLNEYYGRNCGFIWNTLRLTPEGLGLIEKANTAHVSLRALTPIGVVTRLFESLGVAAKPSQPGIVAQRLVRQMGGLQGCRVFKIGGVRRLIAQYDVLHSFTRSAALQLIGDVDPATNLPRFEPYERLFIEASERSKLTPDDAFRYLLAKRVFRVGLELTCPHCTLESWVALDDARSVTTCALCGEPFDVAPLLKDRDWRYRRSGLFGRDDHQQGALPVVVTLQQLDTSLRYDGRICTGSLELCPTDGDIAPCEVDFFFMGQDNGRRPDVGIGECKSGGSEITEEDVSHLVQVGNLFARGGLAAYLIFAKMGAFTEAEVARCAKGRWAQGPRVIMLGSNELEPYLVFAAADATGAPIRFDGTLAGLARATEVQYFKPPEEKK